MSAAPALVAAQKGQGPKAKATTGPKTHSGGSAGGAKAQGGPKATTGSARVQVQHQNKSQGGPKVQAQGATKVKSTNAGGGKKTQSASTTTTASTTSTSTKNKNKTATTTSTTGGTTTLTPVQQKLQRNTNLASKLQGRLPAGTDMMKAAEGFRNLGQFVAAVNVSNNLGLSFTQLKARMVDDGMSLGQAIKDLRPTANTTTEVQRAETDANRLITSTETDASKPARKTRG
jgi:hypothetical protein